MSFVLFNVVLIHAPYPLQIRKGLCPRITDPSKFPEKILFCGWRRDIDDMIMVISSYLIHFPFLFFHVYLVNFIVTFYFHSSISLLS